MTTILLIGSIGSEKGSALTRAGLSMEVAEDEETGLKKLQELHPRSVILQEELNAENVCRLIRGRSPVPIIVLGRRGLNAQLAMLQAGADVYLEQPVSEAELVARVHSLLRRYRNESAGPVLDCDQSAESGGPPLCLSLYRTEASSLSRVLWW